jgi:hypothetical protein
MSGYSLVILICSITLSHLDCQPDTAFDVIRGPPVDNPMMCGLNAQTMMARTDLVRGDATQYMKVMCAPIQSADQWESEMAERKASLAR